MKYFITGSALKEEPLIVEAESRIEAVCSIDLTVWTEEEWKQSQERLKRMDV